MSIASIASIIVILLIEAFIFRNDRKNKLIFSGSSKYNLIMPTMIIAFIALTATTKTFEIQDIVVLVVMLPLVVIGNKNGVSEKGLVNRSYLTPWDKIEKYAIQEDSNNKYMLEYKTNMGLKRIFFKKDVKEEVEKYLLGIKKLKHRRK